MCTPQCDTTTQDEPTDSDRSGTATAGTASGEPAGDWLDGTDVLEAPLPADVRSAFGRFLGREAVGTLGALAAELRQVTGANGLTVDQLCHADEETDHWGTVDGQRYHFRCFYDAVVLAALTDRPVDIRTRSPGGTVVEARAVGRDALAAAPEGAVFSLGIAADAGDRVTGVPTLTDAYAAICPYVRAFPDREAYDRWAGSVPAATVATPLAGATEFAGALVD